jgi:hypothetical protein
VGYSYSGKERRWMWRFHGFHPDLCRRGLALLYGIIRFAKWLGRTKPRTAIFDAIVFVVYYLGFVARCALEVDDASEARLAKITRIIRQCTYGVHDISFVGLDPGSNLPRFNMPLELGLYLGCQPFGSEAQQKKGQ